MPARRETYPNQEEKFFAYCVPSVPSSDAKERCLQSPARQWKVALELRAIN
jgi:hypothetical protein